MNSLYLAILIPISAETPVSQSADTPIEALQGISASGTTSCEALSSLAATGQVNLEALLGLASNAGTPLEALLTVEPFVTQPMEAKGQAPILGTFAVCDPIASYHLLLLQSGAQNNIEQNGQVSLEALSTVTASAQTPIEANLTDVQQVLSYYEALRLALAAGETPAEALSFLSRQIASLIEARAASGVYVPPLGIPAPPFGINELAGTFTHWVDNTAVGATDTGNPNGSPGLPRLTVPTSLPAGSVVEVRGGPYVLSGNLSWTLNGTVGAPVFIRGPSKSQRITFKSNASPGTIRSITFQGAYGIVENLELDAVQVVSALTGTPNHLAWRGLEVHNGTPQSLSMLALHNLTFGVVFDCLIHELGDFSPSAPENDFHGVKAGRFTQDFWLLNSEVYHVGGDGIQIGGAYTAAERPKRVYVGACTLHDNGENAIDIKASEDVICSGNVGYGFAPTSHSDGEAVIIHEGALRSWQIFNEYHTCNLGVACNDCDYLVVLGNRIHDVISAVAYDPNSAGAKGVGIRFYNTASAKIVSNTIWRCTSGITIPSSILGPAEIVNNLVYKLTSPGLHLGVDLSSAANLTDATYNLFYQPGAAARIKWGTSTIYNVAGWRAAFPLEGLGTLEVDPLLVNEPGNDVRLQATSLAISAGPATTPVAYSDFLSNYGRSIDFDWEGHARPAGTGWDIGADELSGAESSVSQSAVVPIEAAGRLAPSPAIPIEALSSLLAVSTVGEEALLALQNSAQSAIEAQGFLVVSVQTPIEAMSVQIVASQDVTQPLEALRLLISIGETPDEALVALSVLAVTPIEAKSNVTTVSQFADVNVEAAGLLVNSSVGNCEALGSLSVELTGAIETLSSLARSQDSLLEARGLVTSIAIVPIEAVFGGVLVVDIIEVDAYFTVTVDIDADFTQALDLDALF